jgi:hypothetical protein
MITYVDGPHVHLRDIVRLAGRIGEVEKLLMPGSEEASDYKCVETGGVLVRMRDDGDLFLLVPSETEDLVLVSRGNQ